MNFESYLKKDLIDICISKYNVPESDRKEISKCSKSVLVGFLNALEQRKSSSNVGQKEKHFEEKQSEDDVKEVSIQSYLKQVLRELHGFSILHTVIDERTENRFKGYIQDFLQLFFERVFYHDNKKYKLEKVLIKTLGDDLGFIATNVYKNNIDKNINEVDKNLIDFVTQTVKSYYITYKDNEYCINDRTKEQLIQDLIYIIDHFCSQIMDWSGDIYKNDEFMKASNNFQEAVRQSIFQDEEYEKIFS